MTTVVLTPPVATISCVWLFSAGQVDTLCQRSGHRVWFRPCPVYAKLVPRFRSEKDYQGLTSDVPYGNNDVILLSDQIIRIISTMWYIYKY